VRPKTKLFAVKFRRILEVLCLQVLQKKFWAQFLDFVLKNEAACCEVQTHFGSVALARLIKKLWARFHDLCVRKQTFLTSTFCENALATFYNLHAHKSLLGCSGNRFYEI